MFTQVDHIDLRVKDLEATVETLKTIGLIEKNRTPAPRSSVVMALPGENQVTFELRQSDDIQGVHHIAFRQSSPEDVKALEEKGIPFDRELSFINETGRTVSDFVDSNGMKWQFID